MFRCTRCGEYSPLLWTLKGGAGKVDPNASVVGDTEDGGVDELPQINQR